MKKTKGIRVYIDPKSGTGKILNPFTLDLLELSESGVLIFRMIEEGYQYNDILEEFTTKYSDIPYEKLKNDLDNLLKEFENHQIIKGAHSE